MPRIVSSRDLLQSIGVVAISSLLVACATEAGSDLADAGPAPTTPSIGAIDPIGSVGHGVVFGPDGKPIDTTPAFIEATQQLYVDALLAQATPEIEATFAGKERALLADKAWDRTSAQYAKAALIEWLIGAVAPADAAQLDGHNQILRNAALLGAAADAPFEVPAALTALLTREGLVEVAEKGTGASGEAYINECRAAGVPIPPDWGSPVWVHRGELDIKLISASRDADVYTYESTSPRGMCIALPRSIGSTIGLLGIICMGEDTGNVCFWDNQRDGSSFPIMEGFRVSLRDFAGGAALDEYVGGECTDCHAGENPYIRHRDAVLGPPALNALPIRPDRWYRPLVKRSWNQNAGPTTILDGVGSPTQCTACHVAGGEAGPFPQVSTETPFYCNTILEGAIARTMPSAGGNEAPYAEQIAALRDACRQPPPPPEPLDGAYWSIPSNFCSHAGATLFTGDFNGDSRDDLLCHDREGGTWIDYADGSGRFGGHDAFVDTNFCTHAGAELRVGRFNSDSRDDLLCHDRAGGTWIDYADTAGRFGTHDWFGDADFCTHAGAELLIGRFNSDSRDDLLCRDLAGGTWIDYASTTGTFGRHDWFADLDLCTHAGSELFVGDVNADGRDDLVCHDQNGGLWIDHASSTGTFARHDWFGDTNFCTHGGARLLLEDVSGDGRGDLVCHDGEGRTWVDRASATGTFAGHDHFNERFCDAPATLHAGRFSSDARVDLLCHDGEKLEIGYSGL
jgi:hypothetical protein